MMPIILNHPIVMQHPKNPDNWIVVKDYHFAEDGVDYTIPRGFVTDFASIPRAFWSIINPTELGDVGPIKHDWKYRQQLTTRPKADAQFLADMKADGISWWKRSAAYRLVKLFGGSSWGGSKVVIEELQDA